MQSQTTGIRVALVDDHALFREGLRAVLTPSQHIEVVAEASTAREMMDMVSGVSFELAILDVILPDASGSALTRELGRRLPSCKVLALSMVDSPFTVAELLRAGAVGFALKSQPTTEIIEAIKAVARRQKYLAPRLPQHEIEALVRNDIEGPIGRLSPREREVFDLLIRGWNNDRIATALSIATRTAETHRQNIMAKLHVHSAVELIRLAAQHGLLREGHA